jgi:hypothetical protein
LSLQLLLDYLFSLLFLHALLNEVKELILVGLDLSLLLFDCLNFVRKGLLDLLRLTPLIGEL